MNFIHDFWREHASRWSDDLVVRFPPEPNGHLHLGHAKAALANADLVSAFGGRLLLRMDDTNPAAERPEFEHGILADLAWLGIAHDPVVRYASDHMPALRELARAMVKEGTAYIDTSSKEALAAARGSFHAPGVASEDRGRPLAFHIEHLEALLAGEGTGVLRARMDLESGNMCLRDPVLWRCTDILHPRLPGWKSFPTYDFAHPFCDVRDGVSLSLCSLEFEERRPLYDAVVALALRHGYGLPNRAAPVELEFARLEPSGGVTSKRKVKAALDTGLLRGWDDPRLLTLKGLRARGYTAHAVCSAVRRLGVSRSAGVMPLDWLDEELRAEVGNAPAALVVPDPVALVLEGEVPSVMKLPGERSSVCGAEFWVSREDVRTTSAGDFRRLAPGNKVRLMGLGVVVEAVNILTDEEARVTSVVVRPISGKPSATVHVLPKEVARPLNLIRHVTWDGTGHPSSCETTTPALAEPALWETLDLVHAPRVGWGVWDESTANWRWVCGMAGPNKTA